MKNRLVKRGIHKDLQREGQKNGLGNDPEAIDMDISKV
jgi:hypothetical protein